jgi:hypothetical protein
MGPDEQTICEVKRHPIGLVGIYVMTGLLMIVLAVLAFIVAPNVITSASRSEVIIIGLLVFLVVGTVALGFVFIAHKVYWGNSWVVTSDSITEITQTSLFDKQSSQLSLGNLEDVTVEQNGILPRMLNYGLVRVETAGERSKFVFPFCPNPSYYAKQILAAREAFEQGRSGDSEQRLYRSEGAFQQSYPSDQTPPPASNYPAAQGVPAYQTPTQPTAYSPEPTYQTSPPSYPPAPSTMPPAAYSAEPAQPPAERIYQPPTYPAAPPGYPIEPPQATPGPTQNSDYSYTSPAAYQPPADPGPTIDTAG